MKFKDNDLETIFIAHSPERVLPGRILRELIDNDRIVGGINQETLCWFSNKLTGKLTEAHKASGAQKRDNPLNN